MVLTNGPHQRARSKASYRRSRLAASDSRRRIRTRSIQRMLGGLAVVAADAYFARGDNRCPGVKQQLLWINTRCWAARRGPGTVDPDHARRSPGPGRLAQPPRLAAEPERWS
jgi:hypothetical protein